MPPRQLALDWPAPSAHGREDFLAAPANRDALAMVERWPDWPERRALLVGPPGSGKTHLAAIWAERSGAQRMQAANLAADDAPALLAAGPLVIEDVSPTSPADAVFHVLNLARETGAWLLLTVCVPPAAWTGGLPDLVSRLRALPTVAIGPADEALLRVVLVKLFHDRQLAVETSVVDYVVPRLERSLDAVRALVARLDHEALSRGRRITRPMVADVLADSSGVDAAADEGSDTSLS